MSWFRIATLATTLLLSFTPVRPNSQVTIEAIPVIDVDGGCVLGGSVDGKWLKSGEMSSRMSGGDKYRTYSLQQSGETVSVRTGVGGGRFV